jgi:hypothetical protein
VKPRGYSQHLQRVICDFGADHAFGQVSMKLQEHYGISVPYTASRQITEIHAAQIQLTKDLYKPKCQDADIIIAESDGSMIPIVETVHSDAKQDRRKNKRLHWREARLSLAHAKDSITPYFAATLDSVSEAGQQLLACVNQSGAHEKTKVHCVGDGAVWIANQVEERFGSNGTYLIDFYHLCEYLSAAAPHCSAHDEHHWLKQQKESMKKSDYKAVLLALKPYVELKTVEENKAPVRACYRYINNRPKQLDYQLAQEQGLPIGSGEVESAHRYVIQKRLKIAGAWWSIDCAKSMLSLRVMRANNLWNQYWKNAA